MDRAVNESLEKLKAELADSLEENLPEVTKFADDPVAFNAAVAKLIGKNLKKDAGASSIQQNYKGTGKKAHRRQLYISIGDAASVDVWLDSGYVNIGGVISPPKGHESKKMMGDMTPEQVYQWLSGTLKAMYAGFAKKEDVAVKEINPLEALRIEAAKKKAAKQKVPGVANYEFKKVADMDDAEVISTAQSLARVARDAREYGEGISSKDSVRFRTAMQRIKDEGMLSNHEEDDLWHQWNGERGY